MGIMSNGSHNMNNTNKGKKKEKFKQICAVLSLVCGIGLVIVGILILLFFRNLVDSIIVSETSLREGSRIAEVWQKLPVSPLLKAYFFNVTNPRRFLNGSKPVLKEIGPFVYQESWEKENVNWLDEGKQVRFGQRKTFKFRDDLSVSDEDTSLTLLNLPMMGALSAVRYTSEEEKVIRAALGSMLEILDQKPFVTVTVKEILWGYENPLIQLGRDIFEGDQAYPFDEFGLFVGKNGTSPGNLTIKTGIDDILNLGKVVAWNDETELDFWRKGSACNKIKGTDGSLFHPNILQNETLYLFQRDLCRSIPLVYQKDIVSNGVPGFRFVPPDDVFSPPDENPDNECYCNNKECNVPRGLFNMTACSFASPIFMSWPHFYQADPKLLDDVVGLKPEKEKHEFFMDLQPKLGVALRVRAGTQINIQLHASPEINAAKGLREIVFPFVWFGSGVDGIEDEGSISLIKTAVVLPEQLRSALYPTCFVIGIILILLVFAFLAYQSQMGSTVRTESITPKREENGHFEMKNTVLASS